MSNNGNELKLKGKLIITGTIKLITGLHIGNTSETLKIGGQDNPVIKDKTGMVFIPGSSLKGKIRSLLEISGYSRKKYYSNQDGKPCDCGDCEICKIFGPHESKNIKEPRRVIVRDGYIKVKDMNELYEKLETKAENTIDRVRGTTAKGGIRITERVCAGAEFDYEVIFNIYKKEDKKLIDIFLTGMKLLEDDYLGGSGSRGYGKIKFKNLKVEYRSKNFYEGEKDNSSFEQINNIDELKEKLEEIFEKMIN